LSNHINVRNKDLDNYLNVMKNQNYANENLSIVIPSFNRCHFLDKSLEVHIPFAKKYNVPIFISDNYSPDNTMKIVKKWQKKYNLIYYHRHPKTLQPDIHFEFALKMPKSRYVWLLGDSSKINNEVFLEILKQSQNDYDMILLNDKGRVKDIKSQLISDHEYLMVSLGWNMSQMSTLIFSKKLINHANYSKFYNSNFIQTGIIFDYLAFKKNIYIKWNQDFSINAIKLDRVKKISWQSITFDIWLRKWAQVVMELPNLYSDDAKLEMIQKHNYNAKIFSVRNLLILRSRNYYSLRHFIKYKQYFIVSIGSFSTTKFILIGLLPVTIIRSILKSKKLGVLTKLISFSGREVK